MKCQATRPECTAFRYNEPSERCEVGSVENGATIYDPAGLEIAVLKTAAKPSINESALK